MKITKFVCGLFLIPLFAGLGFADTSTAPTDVYLNLGPLQLTVPFQQSRIVALYDGVNKQALAGVETVLGTLKINKASPDPWDFELTAGGVTTAAAHGAPVVGINLAKADPTADVLSIANFQLGIFAGYNPNSNGSGKPIMAGAKMAYAMKLW